MKRLKTYGILMLAMMVLMFGLVGCAEEDESYTLTLTIGGSPTGFTNYIYVFTSNVADPELSLDQAVATTSLVDETGASAILDNYQLVSGTEYYLFAHGDADADQTINTGDWFTGTSTDLTTAQCFTVSITSNTTYEVPDGQWYVVQ